MSQTHFNAKIANLIKSSFLSTTDFNAHKSSNLAQIASGSLRALNLFTGALKLLLETPSTTPESRLLSLYFIKEAMDLNIAEFLLYFKEFLYPILLKDALFQPNNPDENRGKTFFGPNPNGDTSIKVLGNSYLKLLLESIEIWAVWYPQDQILVAGHRGLLEKGVKFPLQKTYYTKKKDLVGNRKPEVKGALTKASVLEDFHCGKEKVKGLLATGVKKEVLEIAIEDLKGVIEKIEYLELEGRDLGLVNEKKLLERWIEGYEGCVERGETGFEGLKVIVFERTKPAPIKVFSLNGDETKDFSESQIKRELLTSKSGFERNIDGFMEKLKPLHRIALKPLVNFITEVLQEKNSSSKTQYLCLLLFKVIMKSELKDIAPLITEKAYPYIIELSKPAVFQKEIPPTPNNNSFLLQSEDETTILKDFLGDFEDITIKDVSLLASECVFAWSKSHPLTLEGEDSVFWEGFTLLKENGANFRCFEEIKDNSDFIKGNCSVFDLKNKEFRLLVEELKGFLLKTKKTVKDVKFLPGLAERLEQIRKFYKGIGLKTGKTMEILRFEKEFQGRFSKLSKGLINFTQFKRRFLKYLGSDSKDLDTSKMSKSQKSTSETTNPIQKVYKKEEEVFLCIPQKGVLTAGRENPFEELGGGLLMETRLLELYRLGMGNREDLDGFVVIGKRILESEGGFDGKLNVLRLFKLFMSSNDAKIIQFLHDCLLRSLSIGIYNATFIHKGQNSDPKQEEFSYQALESLKSWTFLYKANIFLCNFKKAWGLLTEDLMIEIPERLLDKSSGLQVFKPSITLISPIVKSKGANRNQFSQLFDLPDKIPLKWFGKEKAQTGNGGHLKLMEVTKEIRVIKENRDLKEEVRRLKEKLIKNNIV